MRRGEIRRELSEMPTGLITHPNWGTGLPPIKDWLEQTQQETKPLSWWQVLLLILAASFGNAAAESFKPLPQEK